LAARAGRGRPLAFGAAILIAILFSACGSEQPPAARGEAPEQELATATATPTSPPPEPTPAPDPTVTLAAVGDIMLARSVGSAVLSEGPGVVFAGTGSLLADAGIAVGNLETAVSERGEAAAKSYTFRAPPAAIEALALAGIDVVSLANNHSVDFGPDALSDTRSLLLDAGIIPVGAGPDLSAATAPAVVTRGGLRVGFLAFVNTPPDGTYREAGWGATAERPGVAWASEGVIAAAVADARRVADVVVVLLHAGTEGSSVPSALQRTLAQAAIDAGAALVLGTHPHVLQPVEPYGDGLIVFSLGNFVFDGFDGVANDSAVFMATLSRTGVQSWELVPVQVVAGLPVLK
jgi:poly-gamma-glutamate synthesis protein (capsule biosynthesis protein)